MNQQIPFLEDLKKELMEHAPQSTPLSRRSKRRIRLSGVWVAGAVFAVTLLVGGLTWLLAGGGLSPPTGGAPTLLDRFSSGEVVYEFRTYTNNQGPRAPCVGVEFDLETGGRRATMACPTESSEEFEYASQVHASPWTFVVGYGLENGETIDAGDAIRVITTESVNGRRFFLIQFGQPIDDSFGIPVTRPDGTTRSILMAPPGDSPEVTPADVGFEFANPEHVRLRFTQTLTLICEGLETVDNDGFDSFDMDIWIDHQSGWTRLDIEYPNGTTHSLILKGRPGAWEQAWGSGTDQGRNAGCGETLDDGGYEQSIAGWAYQDASELWFTAYLKPVGPAQDEGVEIYHEGRPTQATLVGPSRYVIGQRVPGETEIRSEYTVDDTEIRFEREQRYISVSGQFEAEATIEVLESGPTALPPNIFDITDFTPLWGDSPVVTTEATTP